jgi:hypothetical protein
MTLGLYPDLKLADARIKLAEARKLLESGTDPGDVRIQQRKAERTAETVVELAEAYLENSARPRKRSAAEDERMLRRE